MRISSGSQALSTSGTRGSFGGWCYCIRSAIFYRHRGSREGPERDAYCSCGRTGWRCSVGAGFGYKGQGSLCNTPSLVSKPNGPCSSCPDDIRRGRSRAADEQ